MWTSSVTIPGTVQITGTALLVVCTTPYTSASVPHATRLKLFWEQWDSLAAERKTILDKKRLNAADLMTATLGLISCLWMPHALDSAG